MVEERVTETRTPAGETTGTTHTTIITDERRSRGGGWLIALVLLVALIVGVWAFTQFSGAEVAKDAAIADAADDVGNAAQQVGDAAQDAADSLNN